MWQSSDLVTMNGNTVWRDIGSAAVSQRDRVLEQQVQQQTQMQAQSGCAGDCAAAGAEYIWIEFDVDLGGYDGDGVGDGFVFQFAVFAGERPVGYVDPAERYCGGEYVGCGVQLGFEPVGAGDFGPRSAGDERSSGR